MMRLTAALIAVFMPFALSAAGRKAQQPCCAGADGGLFRVGGGAFFVRGVNYYPADKIWDRFWLNFDEKETAADFKKIRELGFNTARIFVNYDVFGRDNVSAEAMRQLDYLIDSAGKNGVLVIVTLFDRINPREFYKPANYAAIDRHLERLIPRYAGNPAVFAWDVKNEPDLDYRFNDSKETVTRSVAHIISKVRQLDNTHMVTVGYLKPAEALELGGQCDFLSFHYYSSAARFAGAAAVIKQRFPDKPVLVEEFGYPTVGEKEEPRQEEYFRAIVYQSYKLNLGGYMAWTLYDHPGLKEINGKERNFGLIRRDGSLKPAAEIAGGEFAIDRNVIDFAPGRKEIFNLCFFADAPGSMLAEVAAESGAKILRRPVSETVQAGARCLGFDSGDMSCADAPAIAALTLNGKTASRRVGLKCGKTRRPYAVFALAGLLAALYALWRRANRTL